MTDFLRNITLDPARPIRVLFICLGNICRSPAAEGILRDVVERHAESALWEIDSAGIGHWHIGQLPDPRMRSHARRRGIELSHICRPITTDDYEHFDIIVGMDDANMRNIRRMLGEDTENKYRLLLEFAGISREVDDPWYSGDFDKAWDDIETGCRGLLEYLKKSI